MPSRCSQRSTSPTKMVWSPSLYWLRLKHSNVAAAPASSGAPLMPGRCSRPAQRSMPRVAKRSASAFWSAASTWMAQCEPSAKVGKVLAPCDRLHSTSGGASDTELKELAVSPTRSPAAVRAVTMVTPVANMPSASRNSRVEKLGGRARVGRGSEGFTKAVPAVAAWGSNYYQAPPTTALLRGLLVFPPHGRPTYLHHPGLRPHRAPAARRRWRPPHLCPPGGNAGHGRLPRRDPGGAWHGRHGGAGGRRAQPVAGAPPAALCRWAGAGCAGHG